MYCRTRPLGGYFGISAEQITPDPGPVINPRDDHGGEEVQNVPRREDGGGHRHGGLQGVQEGIQLGLFFGVQQQKHHAMALPRRSKTAPSKTP